MTPGSHGEGNCPQPLRIFLDLAGHNEWYRGELGILAKAMSLAQTRDAVLVDDRRQADCVLRIDGGPSLRDTVSKCLKWTPSQTPREFIWETGDLPTGGLPGLYVSLPSYMYDRRRHRSFCMPIRCNEMVQSYAQADATFLYGFFGAISSGLRARMIPLLEAQNQNQAGLIEVRNSIWNQMYDRSGLQAKIDYTENLRRCRFILCPKGSVFAGAGSRLYETMKAGRVPVLISDAITMPEGVDWSTCSVQVREKDMARIPEILQSYAERWPEMARNSRQAWENHFSEEAILGELGRQLRVLLAWKGEDRLTTRISGRFRVSLGLAKWKALQAYAQVQKLRAHLRNRGSKN